MTFACIFVPDFPVEALLRIEPLLRSQPVAVLEGKPPLQKVFVVNQAAREAGVEPGMSKLQAEACDGLVLRARSVLQESAAHAALLDCAQSFSPRVEDTAPDTIVLDLDGLESLFGSAAKIARDIARRASELGLEANVAVASNPDTAMLAANGFTGVTVIAPGKEAEHLGSLPIEVLVAAAAGGPAFPAGNQKDKDATRRAERTFGILDTLERWGIATCRAFAALPEIAVSERLGQDGLHLQKLASGATSRTLVPVEPLLVFEEAMELEHPLVLLEPLAFLLSGLLDQLCARLWSRSLATQELRLTLELLNGWHTDAEVEMPAYEGGQGRPPRDHSRLNEDAHGCTRFHRMLQLPVPLIDPKIFLKLLQLDLKSHPPGAPIIRIHLAAEPVRPRSAQGGLFLPPSPEPEKLELTMARIAGIVGEGKVGAVELLDTHHPHGFRMQRFAPREPQETKPNSSGGHKDSNSAGHTEHAPDLVTALRIFRPAVQASVTVREGKPARIVCPKREEMQGEILWTAGPWRSSGGWWEHHGWTRDEWDIALQEKNGVALYRLVRDLLSGQWLVEGGYD